MGENQSGIVMKLENEDQAKAFVWYMAKEISRHIQDIWRAWGDIEEVCKQWDIPKPDLPSADIWVDVKR